MMHKARSGIEEVPYCFFEVHYSDVIMGAMASQITSLTIVYLTVYSGADQRKHQSSASLAFVRGIKRWPVNSPHKGPVTRKMFPFDDVIISAVQFQGQHRFERFRMTTPIRIHEWVWNDTHSLTPNGPFMMMVRVTFVWSVYDVVIE